EDGGIIAGTERRTDQSNGLHRVPVSAQRQSIGRALRSSFKFIGSGTVFPLLIAEHFQYAFDGTRPLIVKGTCISRTFPIVIGQSNRVAERINFPFAFMYARLHVGAVSSPLTPLLRIVVKRVGVWILEDVFCLTVDNASDQVFESIIIAHECHIGPHLRGTIP